MTDEKPASDERLVPLSRQELLILGNTLNYLCHGIALPSFDTYVGGSREEALSLLERINRLLNDPTT